MTNNIDQFIITCESNIIDIPAMESFLGKRDYESWGDYLNRKIKELIAWIRQKWTEFTTKISRFINELKKKFSYKSKYLDTQAENEDLKNQIKRLDERIEIKDIIISSNKDSLKNYKYENECMKNYIRQHSTFINLDEYIKVLDATESNDLYDADFVTEMNKLITTKKPISDITKYYNDYVKNNDIETSEKCFLDKLTQYGTDTSKTHYTYAKSLANFIDRINEFRDKCNKNIQMLQGCTKTLHLDNGDYTEPELTMITNYFVSFFQSNLNFWNTEMEIGYGLLSIANNVDIVIYN